jgi:hypothetical protein
MHKLLLLFTVLLPLTVDAQSLKIGLKASAPLSANLETVQQASYYFADDRNTAYNVRPDKGLEKRFIVFPRLFAQYMLNDNLLLGYETGYTTFLKKYTIRADSDVKNNQVMDTHYDYSFFTNTLYAGYKFLRTRELRPKLYTGITHLTLLRLKEVTNRSTEYYLNNIDPYGRVIHQQVNSLQNSIFAHTIGFGIEYYILNIDLTYDYSLTTLEKAAAMPFYRQYRMLSLSAGINLLGVLPGSSKVKNFRNNYE